MANFLPDNHRNLAGKGTLPDLSADTLKGIFVDNADDTLTTADDYMNDLASAADVPARASGVTLTTKTFGTVAVGVVDFDNVLFSALSGDPSEQFVVWDNTPGTDATNPILAVWDVTVTPNGGDVTVVVNASGAWKF